MIDIYVREHGKRNYSKVDNGPFPLTQEQWNEVVGKYKEQWLEATAESRMMDAWVTTAREILRQYGLCDFDSLMLGNPLAMSVVGTATIKIKEIVD